MFSRWTCIVEVLNLILSVVFVADSYFDAGSCIDGRLTSGKLSFSFVGSCLEILIDDPYSVELVQHVGEEAILPIVLAFWVCRVRWAVVIVIIVAVAAMALAEAFFPDVAHR